MKRYSLNFILFFIFFLAILIILQGCESKDSNNMLSKNDSINDPIKDMVKLEGGSFQMNAKIYSFTNSSAINVMVSPFYLSRYEVTFNEFDRYTDSIGEKRKDDNKRYGDRSGRAETDRRKRGSQGALGAG